jgi:hypothetical protein
LLPSAYAASVVASWSSRNRVGTGSELLVRVAFTCCGVSYVVTWVFQGRPLENRAWSVALTP